MPSIRSSTGSSGGPLRQLHFPDRKKLTIPSTRARYMRNLQKQQSTLTQLNYVTTSSFENDDDEITDPESDEAVPKKKRRLDEERQEENVKQSTLTQWEWLERDFTEDEDDEEDEPQNEDVIGVNGTELAESNGCQSEENIFTPERIKTKHKSDPAFNNSTPHEPIHQANQASSYEAPENRIFRTPQKSVKQEIPSSQSPGETPISTQDDSPLARRTPLQEIHENILAMIDESPSRKLVLPAGRDASANEEDKENFADSPTPKRNTIRTQTEPDVQRPNNSPHNAKTHQSTEDASLEMPPPSTSKATPSSSLEMPGHSTIRTSQATTVDVTQRSDKCSPRSPKGTQTPKRHNSIYAPSPPMEFESQLPESFLYRSDCSPVPSLRCSDDIRTVSQLLPESLLDLSQRSEGS